MDKMVAEKLREEFCDVLRTFAEHGLKTPESVATAKAALSGLVKMRMLDEMERYESERSGRYYYDDDMDHSYRRRDSHGRYMDNGMYRRERSGHDIRPQLERMMEEADSERERMAIRAAMEKL